MDFKGKVAIITGGAQGIGKAATKTLLSHGMKVLTCDINEPAGLLFMEEVQDALKPNVIFQKCDVSSFDDLKAVFEKAKSAFGRIDVVINNAGIIDEKQWRKMIDVNFIGVVQGISLAFEYMGTNNGGSGGFIINTSSGAGLMGGNIIPIYSGTKHAIVGLTRSYGTPYHFDKTGVKVCAVCPGPIDTPLFHNTPSLSLDAKAGNELINSLTPISPEEVANAMVKLLQDGRNGALITVFNDGTKYVE